jgi:non-specific protein-tyrosine kinase
MQFKRFLLLLKQNLIFIFLCLALASSFSYYKTSQLIPLYQANSTLFVSTPASSIDVSSLNTGSNFGPQRVKSYSQVINGEATLEPVIAKLQLPYTVRELAAMISADAPLDTVLINFTVTNRDPKLAMDIANEIGIQFERTVLLLELGTSNLSAPISASVVKPAVLPGSPTYPKKIVNYSLGLLAGLLIALLGVIVKVIFDSRVKNEGDLNGVPLLGILHFNHDIKNLNLLDSSSHTFFAVEIRNIRSSILNAIRRKSTSEPLGSTRKQTNLGFIFQVTSSLAKEGKTTAAISIAHALSVSGSKVLFIEADMRRPGLIKYLKQSDLKINPPAEGLSNLLELEEFSLVRRKISKSIMQIPESKLEILFAGSTPENPAELQK